MPRSAAAMLGIALVAFSIGFNTVRYPVVWEMVAPTGTSEGSDPTNMSPSSPAVAETPAVPRSAVEPPKAMATTSGTVPIFASAKMGLSPLTTPPSPQLVEDAAADETQGTSSENAEGAAGAREVQKAMVPMVPVALSRLSSDNMAESGIRRLPPVVPGYVSPASVIQFPSDSIPIYPTTGIE